MRLHKEGDEVEMMQTAATISAEVSHSCNEETQTGDFMNDISG
jgi:hypothetical protein